MMIKLKKTILSGVVSGTLLVGGIIGGDALIVTPKEEKEELATIIIEKLDSNSVFYTKGTAEVKQALNIVNALYARRASKDEPTEQEWLDAELLVDQLRKVKDSPTLQKIDRLIEVSDANAVYIELELNKL